MADLQVHLQEVTKILQEVGERVEGNLYCDIQPTNVTANLDKINNLRFVTFGKEKICEIGVNACHSFLFMLDVNPNAQYVLFDIGIHKYLEPCFQYLQKAFPNTDMKLLLGDSKLTVPSFAENHLGEFDLVHIDGGHNEPEFTSDYIHSLQLLKPGGLIVFDDYDYDEIRDFVNKKIELGEVKPFQNPNVKVTSAHIVLVKV